MSDTSGGLPPGPESFPSVETVINTDTTTPTPDPSLDQPLPTIDPQESLADRFFGDMGEKELLTAITPETVLQDPVQPEPATGLDVGEAGNPSSPETPEEEPPPAATSPV